MKKATLTLGAIALLALGFATPSIAADTDKMMVKCRDTSGKESNMTREDCKKMGGTELVKCKDSAGKTNMMSMDECKKAGGTEVKE